jgi:hypothetical protein
MPKFMLPPPQGWQVFEENMQELLRKEYRDPYLKIYGRSGQSQQGIDISSRYNKYGKKIVFQCKCNEHTILKPIDIEKEYLKVVNSNSHQIAPIDEFILLTTSSRDTKYEDIAEKLTVKHGIYFHILTWQDIVSLYEKHTDIMKEHYAEFVIDGKWRHYCVGKIFGITINDPRGPQARYELMITAVEPADKSNPELTDAFYSKDLYVICDLNLRKSITWRKGDTWHRLSSEEGNYVGYGRYDAYLVTCWLNSLESIEDMLFSGEKELYYSLTEAEFNYWMKPFLR